MKITRMLRGIKFFHEGTELDFDDIKVSVIPNEAIGKTFSPDKSQLFSITFTKTEEENGGNIVVITAKKHIVEERYSPFIVRKDGEHYTVNRWFYSFTSYFPMGTLSLVPPIHAEGTIESKEELDLEVGKNYTISLIQDCENKDQKEERTC